MPRSALLAVLALVVCALAWVGFAVWRGATPASDESSLAARLQALGYAEWSPADAAGHRGVTRLDASRSQPGVNLYSSRHTRRAFIVDAQGELRHTWHHPGPGKGWHHVELTPQGDLLAVAKGLALERLSWDSELLWRVDLATHHDVALDEAGRIYTLVSRVIEAPFAGGAIPIVEETVVQLSPEGRVLKRIPLHPLLADRLPASSIAKIRRGAQGVRYWFRRLRGKLDVKHDSDIYHANSIEILPRDVPGFGSKGDALVAIRQLDLLAVIDLDVPRLVWSGGAGELEKPHHPSLLQNGNLLVFDNGPKRGWSRVVELAPLTGGIVWEYSGDPSRSLFSRTRGSSQKLANGNVLVTESDRGRTVEVTPTGETVWEFYNPEVDESGERRRPIYRMTRFDASILTSAGRHGDPRQR